jgi:hypothetical protein
VVAIAGKLGGSMFGGPLDGDVRLGGDAFSPWARLMKHPRGIDRELIVSFNIGYDFRHPFPAKCFSMMV